MELPPAGYSHSELARRIAALFGSALHPNRIWGELGYKLAPALWQQPDVSITWPDQAVVDDYPQGAPMIAVEIASQGNTDQRMEEKRLLYLEHGAGEVWIIYPKMRTMLVSSSAGIHHIAANERYRCELGGVTITPEYRTSVVP